MAIYKKSSTKERAREEIGERQGERGKGGGVEKRLSECQGQCAMGGVEGRGSIVPL